MARVTVEDSLAQVHNRFALTILAARRARVLGEGRGSALVDCDNKEGVTALREISDGYVRYTSDVEQAMRDFIQEQRRQLRVTTGEHTFLEAATLRAMEEDDDDDDGATEGAAPEDDLDELPADPDAMGDKAVDGDDDDDDGDAEEGEEFDEEAATSFPDDLPADVADAPEEDDGGEDDDASS